MAYTYVSAKLRARGKNTAFENVDISQMLMSDIFANYVDGYIKLTNPAFTAPKYVYLETLKKGAVPVRPALTFETWLASNANRTIPAANVEPTLTTTNILYSDAWRALYDIARVHPITHPSVPQPLGTRTDLMLSRDGGNIQDMADYLMVTVNGLFHLTDYHSVGLRVKKGGQSVELCNQNNVGLVSFKDIGKLTYVPIQSAMLQKPEPTYDYSDTTYLDLGVDLSGKSVMLVIGGYLHVNDAVYDVVDAEAGIVKVNVNQIDLVRRIFESKKIIDLTSLNLSVAVTNEDIISLLELNSDAVIESYLTLPQSFAVVVDTPYLYHRTHIVGKPGLPDFYESPAEPLYPLQLQTGIMPEYWCRKQDNVWVLTVNSNKEPNYLYETTRWRLNNVVDNATIAQKPYDYSLAHLFQISSDVLS